MEIHGNLIGGAWRREGRAHEVRSPYDGALVAQVTLAGPELLGEAVEAAVAAQPAMAALSREAR